jgi:hypothetical protein
MPLIHSVRFNEIQSRPIIVPVPQIPEISVSQPPEVPFSYNVVFTKDSDWGSGYNGKITIVSSKSLACFSLTCSPSVLGLQNPISWVSDMKYTYDSTSNVITFNPERWAYKIEANVPKIITLGGSVGLTNFVLKEVSISEVVVDPQQPPEAIIFSTDNKLVPVSTRRIKLKVNESITVTTKVPITNSYSNNKDVIGITYTTNSFTVTGKKNGRGCLKVYSSPTTFRFIGILVGSGTDTSEFPIGMVSEDDPSTSMAFWVDFDESLITNKRCENRYVYLNGGPGDYGWRLNYTTPEYNLEPMGKRAITFLRNSVKLGMVPVFVYYNIADGGESYTTDLEHVQSRTYMTNYFTDLTFLLNTINVENKDDITRLVLEPDFLGYMMQNSGKKASEIQAYTSTAYSVKGCLTIGVDPQFEDSISGLVQSINYIIRKICPQVEFGWQINAWSNPVSIPGGIGICKSSDFISDFEMAKKFIAKTATDTATYYKEAGIMSNGAHFFTVDKYGLDYSLVTADKSLKPNPWSFNSDHWNNYLLYVKTISDILDNAACQLWQLPVGHLNSTSSISPYTGKQFVDLPNTVGKGEDSTVTFFFGDTFTPPSGDYSYWSQNKWNDPLSSSSGLSITWKSRIKELQKYNISNVMVGAGVGTSTTSNSNPISGVIPGDNYFCISKIQDSYKINKTF